MSASSSAKTILIALAVLLLGVLPCFGATITENFDNNQYNDDLFWLFNMGQGVTAQVVNERLEIGIPANVDGMGNFGVVDYLFAGDFDLQVDFSLLNWPAHNQTQVMLGAGAAGGQEYLQVARANGMNDTEIYFTLFKRQWTNDTAPAAGNSGKLRIKRTGNTAEAMFWDGAAWQTLGSYADPMVGKPSYIFMNFSRNAGGADSPAIAGALDNIKITYNELRSGYFIPAPLAPLLLE
jgi:hypothetical protein